MIQIRKNFFESKRWIVKKSSIMTLLLGFEFISIPIQKKIPHFKSIFPN